MVLILSDDSDLSTNEVIDYLIRYDIDYVRINDLDIIENVSIELSNAQVYAIINTKSHVIDTRHFTAFWYRRGTFTMAVSRINNNMDDVSFETVNDFLISEAKGISSTLHQIVLDTPVTIGDYTNNFIEKTKQLSCAIACGIAIPESHIFCTKEEVRRFLGKFGEIATKGIRTNFFWAPRFDVSYFMYTSIIDRDNIDDLSNRFAPTLFQEYVHKKIELRIFYLHGEFFPMAIFSQSNELTKVDFRRYDCSRPNRTTPFNLPGTIKLKLHNFMRKLGIDTGSIDMVVKTDGTYTFLEVNPVGQFGMVSYPCNYFIERRLAQILSGREKQN